MELMRKARPILLILALSFLIRVAAVWELKKFPVFEHPQLDEMEYDEWAKEISDGIILRTYVPLHSPGYAFFLAFAHRFLPAPYLSSRLLQSLVSTVNVLLIFLVAGKIFGRGPALISAVLAAFFWPMVYFQARLLPPTLNIFFLLLSVTLALAQEKRPKLSSFLSGGSLALAGIFWPLILSVAPGFLLWTWISRGWKRTLLPGLLFSIGLAVPLFLIAYQNYYAEQDLVLTQKNFGLNFYLGNNPESPGIPYLRLGGKWDTLQAMAMIDAGAEKPSDQNRYYLKKWMAWAGDHPSVWLNLLTRKTKLLFDNREIIASFDPDFYRARMISLRLCPINSGLIIALGLLGLFSARIRGKGLGLVGLCLFFFGVALALTLISSRYRLGWMALLLIPAGYGVQEMIAHLFSRELFRSLIALGFVTLSFLISALPLPRLPDQSPYEYIHLGQAYLEQGDFKLAGENFAKALPDQVSRAGGYLGLAKVAMDSNNLPYAQSLAQAAIKFDPDWAHSHQVLGQILMGQGDLEGALAQFRITIGLRPQYLKGWISYADALIEAEKLDQAEKAIRTMESLRRDSPSLLLLKAKLALKKNQGPEGLHFLKAYLKLYPADKTVQYLVKQIEEQNKK